jgi:hypothetical protein
MGQPEFTSSTGAPFTIITGGGRSLTGTSLGSANWQRVNQVLGDV